MIAVPDPYVERWFLADPTSLREHLGGVLPDGPPRSTTGWKKHLVAVLEGAGEIVTQGGAEFAEDIVNVMDQARASQAVPSLGTFFSDVRSALRRLQIASA